MRLSRVELARAFAVSTNTVGFWVLRGCPRRSAGGPGVPSVFDWNAVERWAYEYKIWRYHAELDEVIGAAYHRAKAIVKERNKQNKRKPHR